jgi:hypothetical protein
MAMMEPLSGLSQFLSVLTELRLGERSPFPFYCCLLYTVADGLDTDLARYVDANWEEMDAMTGDSCLVFVVGDRKTEAAAGHKPFSPQEVYRIADHLGVRPTALPCAAFFADPEGSREMLRVRLTDYIGHIGHIESNVDGATLTRAFRSMSSALTRCSAMPAETRLDCLRRELIQEQELAFGPKPSSAGERLSSAASTVGSVEQVVVGGATIATTVLRLLGIGI